MSKLYLVPGNTYFKIHRKPPKNNWKSPTIQKVSFLWFPSRKVYGGTLVGTLQNDHLPPATTLIKHTNIQIIQIRTFGNHRNVNKMSSKKV